MVHHGMMLIKFLILKLKITDKNKFLFPKGNVKCQRHLYTYNVHFVHAYVYVCHIFMRERWKEVRHFCMSALDVQMWYSLYPSVKLLKPFF
jgi:hypothetical protein